MSTSSLNSSQKQLFEQQPKQAGSFIDRQLQRATAQVRIVDVLGGFLVWSSCTLAFLLLLAIVDAWIFSLPVAFRLTALVVIVAGSLVYLVSSLWPLLTRRINPMYAAKMLEEGQPGLKNSLVNFLSFRETPDLARKRILSAMANKAAIDLSSLSIETTVDRGKLIRFGYLLVGLVAICAAYLVLSPKSPLTTVGRIIAPLADVPPPSRVRIRDVQPGDVEVTFGESLQVVAEVEGLGRDELVELLFTTDDRQRVDAVLPMILDESRGVYVASLVSGTLGVEHPLTYVITAGDARSAKYRVSLRQAVTATIDQVELIPPAYTELPTRQETRGDVEGVEGTEVVVRGKANFPLQAAVLELLRPGDGAVDRADPSRKPAKRIRMELNEDEFVGRFKLELAEDRTTPTYADYRIALLTTDRQTNTAATHYRIAVFPDMAPEIRWIRPQETEVELPANGRLVIETQAIDRDFAISRVVLRGDHKGRQILGEELLDASRQADDQHLGKYNLRPEQLGLAPGDTVVLYAMAEDNRCHPQSGLPDPNSVRTENVTVRITGADPRASSQGTEGGSAGAESSAGGDTDTDSQQSTGGETGDSATNNQQETGSEGDPESGTGAGQTQPRSEDMNQSETGEGTDDAAQPQGSGAAGTDSSDAQSQEAQGASGSSSAGGDGAEQQSETKPGAGGQDSSDPAASGGQTTQGGGSSPTDPNSQPDASAGETGGGAAQGNRENNPASGSAPGEPTDSQIEGSPDETPGGEDGNSGDAPHEGDVFDKILERIKQQQSGESQSEPTDSQENQATENEDPGGGETAADGAEDQQQPEGGADQDSAGSGGTQETSDNSGQSTGPQDGAGQTSRTGDQPQGGAESTDPMGQEAGSTGEETRDGGQGTDPETAAEGGTDTATDTPSTGGQSASDSSAGTEQTSEGTGTEQQADPSNDGAQGADPAGGDPAASDTGAGGEAEASDEGETDPQAGNEGETSDASSGRQPGAGDAASDARSSQDSGNDSRSGNPGDQAREAGSGAGSDGELPEGEKANLEYSRRATDLVLDYLKDQEQQPDSDLLSDLNWTAEDLKDFLARWEAMRQAAREGSPEAQDKLTRRIRSLGLMPQDARVGSVDARDDNLSGIVQDGAKSSPPPEFAEKFRLFLKGAAQAESKSDTDTRTP